MNLKTVKVLLFTLFSLALASLLALPLARTLRSTGPVCHAPHPASDGGLGRAVCNAFLDRSY